MANELDIKALRYFVAVAQQRSYTLAAAHLRMTQPAITRQIQAIERDHGVRLFRRDGRHVVVSEAGAVLLEQAQEILGRLDATSSLMKQAALAPTGRLTIGAPPATGERLLPLIIRRYREKYPQVFIHVISGYTGDLAEMLADGRLDMALVLGTPSHGDLELRPLVDLGLGLVAPAHARLLPKRAVESGAIALMETAQLPLIFPSKAQTLRTVVEQAFSAAGVKPNIILESDSLPLSKALVTAGVGYMFLGRSGVQRELEDGRLQYLRLASPQLKWRLSIATRKVKSKTLAVRMMALEIAEVVRLSAHEAGWTEDTVLS
ncbi:LysR family transcriptional regulator [Hydrogenophaga sp.]|uniref:LysR family transcriptional regulator n=1 Tax=Hydrogenophaga sp. TaxID=1904254 RepID=UPI0027244980|nr:LysR family transcriptional regulator [Hydrogenophaga sp.]MDO9435373.1 LysR family transcriptional regulator [Hydrogenophaga sp.]